MSVVEVHVLASIITNQEVEAALNAHMLTWENKTNYNLSIVDTDGVKKT